MVKAESISPGFSWYEDSVVERPAYPCLLEHIHCDVAIIGGGFTGQSAAQHLANAGVEVALIDADLFGNGASGRNGGQLGTGQRQWVEKLEKQYGFERTQALFDLSQEAKADVLKLHDQYDIDFVKGQLSVAYRSREVKHYQKHIQMMQRYGYDDLCFMDKAETATCLGSSLYHAGIRDTGTGHVNPLKMVIALAKQAKISGAKLFEKTTALQIKQENDQYFVITPQGQIKTKHILLATNAYHLGLQKFIDHKIIAIRSYIGATPPVPDDLSILMGGEAVDDSRFVVRYFRKTKDNRLLFGGAENYNDQVPNDILQKIRQQMVQVYPRLNQTKFTHHWGGTVGITVERMPYVNEVLPNITYCGGYSGHGVMLAPFLGKLFAESILGNSARLDQFKQLKISSFPGGGYLRQPLLFLAMKWFSMLDRL